MKSMIFFKIILTLFIC